MANALFAKEWVTIKEESFRTKTLLAAPEIFSPVSSLNNKIMVLAISKKCLCTGLIR